MGPNEVKDLIQRAIPDAQIQVQDMTGGSDHFHILVVSSVFKGKMLIDQHRLVQQPLQAALDDGRIHAVQIKTQTPEAWANKRSEEEGLGIIE